jgi:hypothetical protein
VDSRLGCVDVFLFEPSQSGDEVKEGQIAAGEFVEATEDAPVVLDVVEESPGQMAFCCLGDLFLPVLPVFGLC